MCHLRREETESEEAVKKITETPRLILFPNIFIRFIFLKAQKGEKKKKLILPELFSCRYFSSCVTIDRMYHIFEKEK